MPDGISAEELAEEKEFAAAFAEEDGAPGEDDPASSDSDFDLEDKPGPEVDPDLSEDGLQDGEDPAPEPDEGDDGGKGEMSLEDKAHGYDSMFGRLEKERSEKEQLKFEIERLRSQAAQPSMAPAPVEEPKADVPEFELPEELQEDYSTIEKEDPQIAALFKEDSRDGKKLRKILSDYGPDVASIQAGAIQVSRNAGETSKSVVQSFEQKQAEQAVEDHLNHIYSALPDYKTLTTDPARATESQQYHQALREWIGEQPHKEAVRYEYAIDQGSPEQVVELLSAFNEAQNKGEKKPNVKDAANAAMTVPSKPAPMPKSKGAKDDFDAGWED